MEKRQKSNKLVPRTETVKLLTHLLNFTALVYAPVKRAVNKTFTVKAIKGIYAKNLVIPGETLQILKGENTDLKGDFNFEFENEINSVPTDNYFLKNPENIGHLPPVIRQLPPVTGYLNLENTVPARPV